jgi:hypothetical protein
MTEAEIAYQVSEYLDRVWSMQQWWASVSIGVLVMAHLASDKLNLFLVGISLALYTTYTLYMQQMSRENVETVFALLRDLEVLVDSGEVSSNNAEELLEILTINPLLFILTFGGTYVCVASYVIYSYIKIRGHRNV